MDRNKGTFLFPANLQVKMQEALDPRVVVSTKAELIDKSSWPSDGDTLYLYKGLVVGVIDEHNLYMLVDVDKALYADYSGWVLIAGESGNTPPADIDPELFEAFVPLSRDFSDDFNNDFAR